MAEARVPMRRRPSLLVTAAVIAAVVLVAALALALVRPEAQSRSPVIGRDAADFALTTLEGDTLTMAELRGEVVILNFWASWCVPCREEAPLLEQTRHAYEARGLRVVGVLYQDSPEDAAAFAARYELGYPSVVDPDGRTAIDYGVVGIPASFLIDRGGVIRELQVGPYTDAAIQALMEEYLS